MMYLEGQLESCAPFSVVASVEMPPIITCAWRVLTLPCTGYMLRQNNLWHCEMMEKQMVSIYCTSLSALKDAAECCSFNFYGIEQGLKSDS